MLERTDHRREHVRERLDDLAVCVPVVSNLAGVKRGKQVLDQLVPLALIQPWPNSPLVAPLAAELESIVVTEMTEVQSLERAREEPHP